MWRAGLLFVLSITVMLSGCKRSPEAETAEPAADAPVEDAGTQQPASEAGGSKAKDDAEARKGSSGVKGGDESATKDADAPDADALSVGDPAPEVVLRTANDQPFNLADAYAARPTMVIFYRGGWCPYCNEHLKEVAEVQQQIRDMGLRILAISPDRPLQLKKTLRKHDLPYQLLSDSDMTAAEAFGVAFEVGAPTLQKYDEYGIDLEEASGHDHHKLPVPSVYIVDTAGVIRFAHSNPDYKVRLSKQDMLAAAESAL